MSPLQMDRAFSARCVARTLRRLRWLLLLVALLLPASPSAARPSLQTGACAELGASGCSLDWGQSASAVLASGEERHAWRLSLPARGGFWVQLGGLGADYDLVVVGPDGAISGASRKIDTEDELVALPAAEAGEYTAYVVSGLGQASSQPYRLSATRSAPIDSDNVSRLALQTRWGRGGVIDLAYSADGQQLAATSSEGVYLLEAAELNDIRSFDLSRRAIAVAFSPDGETVIALFGDGPRTWRARDGAPPGQPRWHWAAASQSLLSPAVAAISTDLQTLAVAQFGRPEIFVLGLADGRLQQTLGPEAATTSPERIAISPDDQFVAAAWPAPDATVRVWRLSGGSLVQTLRGQGDERWEDLSFSADSQLLSAAGQDVFSQWRWQDGAPLVRLAAPQIEIERSGVSATGRIRARVAVSPDGGLLASPTKQGIVVYRVADGAPLWRADEGGFIGRLLFSPDGSRLAVGTMAGRVTHWDSGSGAALRSRWEELTPGGTDLALTPNGSLAASAGGGGRPVVIRRVMSGTVVRGLPSELRSQSLAFAPDNDTLAVATAGEIQLWRASDGLRIGGFITDGAPRSPLAFRPDGGALAGYVVPPEGGLPRPRLWRLPDGALLSPLGDAGENFPALSFSPAADLLATTGEGSTIKLWRASDGAALRDARTTSDEVQALAISPDGQVVAATVKAGDQFRVDLVRVDDGVTIRSLAPTWQVQHFAWSPDGALLAAAPTGQPIELWRVADGQRVHKLEATANSPIHFLPDGQFLVVPGSGATVQFWGAR